jgi:hypothetical protein
VALPWYSHSIGRLAQKLPGFKRIPIVKLLMVGEVVLLAREHYERLSPPERRRLMLLLRDAKGRPSTLSEEEHAELEELLEKAAPRLFAAEAADRLSPVPIPGLIKRKIAGQ